MFGFAIDENPVPDSTLGYELPDSDAKIYSCGFEKNIDEKSSFGMAYLFDDKESRTVTNADVAGTFTGAGAHLLTMAYKLRF
jgi:long-chain fatty acid transport protein